MTRKLYRGVAIRDGRWWFVTVPDERGLFTQARRLDQAEPMLREVIGLMRQVPEDSFDVVVQPDLSSLGPLRATVEHAVRERGRAAQAQESASAAIREAVARIRDAGFTTRDAGMLLGLSPQRVSQVVRSKPPVKSPSRAAETPADYGRD
jgi:predicted RNase H-like HicB family nuclease